MSVRSWSAVLFLLATLHAPAPARDVVTDGASPKAAKKPKAEAADPFAEASRLKRSASGKSAEEKHAALTAAAHEYERTAKASGLEPAFVAEAHWRAGEIWRTLRHEEEARACFEATTKLVAAEPRLAAKAWLEIGHLDRRAKRYDAAIASYRRVLSLTPEQRRESAQALTWHGKALLAKGDTADGHALLLSVGQRYAEFEFDDVRNVDLVACDWIEAGRIAEARTLVDDCLKRHAEDDADRKAADPDDADGDQEPSAVQRALDKMKSRKLLTDLLLKK